MKLEELDLNSRSYSCLKRNGVNTVEELLNLSECDLKNFRNMSFKVIEEINRCLKDMNFYLKTEEKYKLKNYI